MTRKRKNEESRLREVMPRKRSFTHGRVFVEASTTRKCRFCQKNVSTREMYRIAHENACIGLNMSSASTVAGTDEEVASSQNVSYEAPNDTHDEPDDMDTWTTEFPDDNVYIDDVTATSEENYENVHDDVTQWLDTLAERGTLSLDHIVRYMHWGPLPLTTQETHVAEFLSTVTGGVGMSEATTNKLLGLWNRKNGPGSMPATEQKCWEVIERAHERMTGNLQKRTVTVEIPPKVQELLYEGLQSITWEFWNPCELLIRMLTMGPLSAEQSALALFPVESEYLEDFCHGDKMKRIFAAIPKNTTALSSILFFDEINRDQKGYATGEGAIVVGAFFNKDARNSTYAKASFGTFPKINIPKVSLIVACPVIQTVKHDMYCSYPRKIKTGSKLNAS